MSNALKIFILASSFLFTSCKTTDVVRVLDTLNQSQGLSQQTVAAGLKQALQVGTEKTVFNTNRNGGFSSNPLIKILVPEKLENVASTVRKVGLGSYVDKFELQMNRAAESAAGEAKTVFFNAISGMSLQDAWGILRGGDNAATNYFKANTTEALTRRFKPIITSNMQKVGFYQDYNKLINTYNAIPFTKKQDLSIETYVTDKALAGLFSMVAKEEAKIRQDPLARTTELLQKVFADQ
ncbi:DUF4197 domain-containing protein [Kangiella sp. HZ709]|uniref:DUF4197 domain-containing protein n=1 Tax=Kangiella sp. HZ709 TaxID=2666328 RepID=UPI0012B0F592|nr:DUF4197 domain-containing protein [Kangiella sp. HZ709]MRX27839.1 DUF4197 family protein [Kangiella sp. HZ709]